MTLSPTCIAVTFSLESALDFKTAIGPFVDHSYFHEKRMQVTMCVTELVSVHAIRLEAVIECHSISLHSNFVKSIIVAYSHISHSQLNKISHIKFYIGIDNIKPKYIIVDELFSIP